MRNGPLLIASIVQVVFSTSVSAQERYSPLMAAIDKVGDFLIGLFERPLRPDIATVAPGSGIGAGLTFSPACRSTWCVDANGVVTVRSYWGTQGSVSYNTSLTRVAVYGSLRDMSRLDFFGLGNSSHEADRTNFRMRDRLAGLRVEARAGDWLDFAAGAEMFKPELSAGRSSTLPSIESVFTDAQAPGLTQQPTFARYHAALRIDLPAGTIEALNQGGEYRATYSFYADRDLDRYSFGSFDVEGRQRFRLLGDLRRLTLHGRITTTMAGAGNDVPFYLMPTLGGFQLPHGAVDETIGSDGTPATLRGYTNYRFRDRHIVLLQAEYRMPLWGPIDVSVFGDAGKVASTRSDLDLSDLHRNAGAGISIMRGPSTAVRLDVAFGGEGTRLFFTIGRVVAP